MTNLDNATNPSLEVDEINAIIRDMGVDTTPYTALWATETSDRGVQFNDYNSFTCMPSVDEAGVRSFVQGWIDAVGYNIPERWNN
jgi:hypothetical protein